MTQKVIGISDLNRRDILQRIIKTWEVSPHQAKWHSDKPESCEAVSWWPGDFQQTIRAVRYNAYPDPAVRIRIDTSFLREFDVLFEPAISEIASIGHLLLPSSAWVYHPADLQHPLKDQGLKNKVSDNFDLSRLWLTSTAYIRDESAGWLPEFVARMTILQPIIAQNYVVEMSKSLKAVPDSSSHPLNPDAPLDGIMDLLDALFVPAGKEPNRWIESKEFVSFDEEWGRSDNCFATGDPTGMTAETPFGEDSALIRIYTDQPHPLVGNGLLVTLQIPVVGDLQTIAKLTGKLNYMEANMWTQFHLLGCWHAHPLEGKFVAAFSMFVPNLLYQPFIATNSAIWMMHRARWVRENLYSDLVDLPMREILMRRFNSIQ